MVFGGVVRLFPSQAYQALADAYTFQYVVLRAYCYHGASFYHVGGKDRDMFFQEFYRTMTTTLSTGSGSGSLYSGEFWGVFRVLFEGLLAYYSLFRQYMEIQVLLERVGRSSRDVAPSYESGRGLFPPGLPVVLRYR